MEVSYWPIAAFRKGQLTARSGHSAMAASAPLMIPMPGL